MLINEEIKQKLDDLVNKNEQDDNNTLRVKKQQDGLIERVKSSKKILTEDNRQVLFG